MSAAMEKVFVYGTLRRGGSNHFRLDGAEFLTTGEIIGRLYRIDWYPGLVLDPVGDDILGEVYTLDLEILANLDRYEGLAAGDHEGSEYRRVLTTVTSDAGETFTAWVWEWLGECDENQRLSGGDWLG
jgi:gamma-glutamylcyclotransferase (GGCT)/AIG2-like uncharacterized protein YtfP